MARIDGEPEQVLAQVQSIVREVVPEAVCELQDYHHRIGCGGLDEWGSVRDVKFTRDEWDDEIVRHKAEVLKTRYFGQEALPRASLAPLPRCQGDDIWRRGTSAEIS